MQIIENHGVKRLGASVSNQKGFTLVELGVVLVLVGIILLGLTYASKVWLAAEERESLEQVMTDAQNALNLFRTVMLRYPCPADPTLEPTDPLFGVEDCNLTPVAGARDTDYDADADPDEVLVGMFPIIAIDSLSMGGRPPSDGSSLTQAQVAEFGVNLIGELDLARPFAKGVRDPWGNNLTYAVTLTQTIQTGNDGNFDGVLDVSTADDTGMDLDGDGFYELGLQFEFGAIQIIDEEGRDTGGTRSDAHYVIISPGEIDDCDASFEIEYENCDDDGVFRAALSEANIESEDRYDDTIGYEFGFNNVLWTNNVDLADPDADPDLVTTNQGRVIIGNETNTSLSDAIELEVQGDIYAEKRTASNKYCDETDDPATSGCLVPESFTNNIECENAGQYIKEVYYDADGSLHVTCEDFSFLEYKTCKGGRYLKGVYSDGTPSCAKPTKMTQEEYDAFMAFLELQEAEAEAEAEAEEEAEETP